MRHQIQLRSILYVLVLVAIFGCGQEEDPFECGCGGTIKETFINSKAIVSYNNPGFHLLTVYKWDELNQDSVIQTLSPCDFPDEDRMLIAQDGLELRVSGQSHFVCDQVKYVGRPFTIEEYTIVE
ncbi:MAG: hypothetical protein RIC80_08250 [Cyclobacteriaceae bacterium]